jgi:anti-sigma factor RsiW
MNEESELSRLIRDALPTHAAPVALREWARERARSHAQSVGKAESDEAALRGGHARPWHRLRTVRYAAGLLLAASLGFAGHALLARLTSPSVAQRTLVAELVDDHVASLMAGHLMDVQSTDQHTVKPWFAGRADFAPRVTNLDSVGFPLLGARLTYVQGHTAAVLVYGRRKHVINVFMWRAADAADTTASPTLTRNNGYAVAHWVSGGLSFWAITDAAPAELEAFRAAYMAD